ncbi:putative lipoprotein [Minicystis rosea]|nr:putative lipoprotein [Minicystis rosea]
MSVVGCADPSTVEEVASDSAPLTSTDVDVAPECQGIIDFVNVASFATLDAYLPSNVAQNIVTRRSSSLFTSIADLASVSLVGDARLTQIHQGAGAEGYIGASCIGIYDQLAVSSDDAAAIVSLVNSVSSTELHDYLPDAWNGASNLLNLRPFTTVAQISNTSGIGPSSVRRIRNAATLAKPFEAVAAAATGLHRDADILTQFDWFQKVVTADDHYHQGSLTCFGLPLDYMPSGTTVRSNLADATEVYNEVVSTLTFANRYNELGIDPTAGLANLQSRLAGHTFFGCYISYADDPWSGNNQAFFVDPDTGFHVLTETRWSE